MTNDRRSYQAPYNYPDFSFSLSASNGCGFQFITCRFADSDKISTKPTIIGYILSVKFQKKLWPSGATLEFEWQCGCDGKTDEYPFCSTKRNRRRSYHWNAVQHAALMIFSINSFLPESTTPYFPADDKNRGCTCWRKFRLIRKYGGSLYLAFSKRVL